MNEAGVLAFGEWDAPLTDGAGWLAEAPVELTCMYCNEHFREGDNGAIMPHGFAQHRECGLRSVWGGIGHIVNHERYCYSDPDAGLSLRQSALLVWRHYVEGVPVTEDELDELAA